MLFEDGTLAWYPDEHEVSPEAQLNVATSHVQYFREYDSCSFVIHTGASATQLWAKTPNEASEWVAALVRVQHSHDALHYAAHLGGLGRVLDPRLMDTRPGLSLSNLGTMPAVPRRQLPKARPSALSQEHESMMRSEEFQRRKEQRISAAKQALADAPVLPMYGQVIEQEGADGKSSFVYATSCAPIVGSTRWSALMPGPAGYSSAQLIAATRRGTAPIGTVGDGNSLALAAMEHSKLEAENLALQRELASVRTGSAPAPLQSSASRTAPSWAIA